MKPRRNVANPVRLALMGAAKLSAKDRAVLGDIADRALADLGFGTGDLAKGWKDLVDLLNIAEQLCELGICSDDDSRDRVAAGQKALTDLYIRHRGSRSWTCKGAELLALREALWLHKVQLQHCSLSEYERAEKRVRDRSRAALHGNVRAGAQVLGGSA